MKWFLPGLLGLLVGIVTSILVYLENPAVEPPGDFLGVSIKSAIGPDDDAKAFELIGMIMPEKATVIHRSFQAGMDDSMKVVFDLPTTDLEAFWKASPFAGEKKKEVRSGVSATEKIGLPGGQDRPWNQWQGSKRGWYSAVGIPGAHYLQIYAAEDQVEEGIRCYLFWHES